MVYVTKDAVETYLKAYIESYMESIKAQKTDAGQLPAFCKGYPFTVKAYIMPNEGVACLIKYETPNFKIEVLKEKYENIKALIQKKEHNAMMAFPPVKSMTKEDAKKDAAFELGKDMRHTTYKMGLDAAKNNISDIQTQVQEIAKTNPWLERQLLGVADKLGKTNAPLTKLWDEFKRLDEDEKYSEHEQMLVDLQKYKVGTDIQVAAITEDVVEKYIRSYIEAYRETIKPEYPEAARPAFFKGYPFHVRVFILPNEAVAVTFKYSVPSLKLEVAKATPELVHDLLKGKEHSNFMGIPPLRSFKKEDAVYDAKLAVKRDMRNALFRALLDSARSQIGEEEKNILEISKTNPWLEKQLTQAAARLSGVKQLLAVLVDELEKGESGRRYGDHEQLLDMLERYKPPAQAEPPMAQPDYETVPMEAPVAIAAPQPYYEEVQPAPQPKRQGTQPQYAAVHPQSAPQPVYAPPVQEPPEVRYEMAPEDKQTLDMIKATLYNIDVKLDDFERRLNYMDKYVEGVQKQQADKFKIQEEILRKEASSAKYGALGISATALVISIIFLIVDYQNIWNSLKGLFGL